MSEPTTDTQVTATLPLPTLPHLPPQQNMFKRPEPVSDEPFADRLAEDHESLAAVIRADPTGRAGKLLSAWPMLIHPDHVLVELGPARAMTYALRVLRPVAVREIKHQIWTSGIYGHAAQLFVDIPLRTRAIVLVVHVDGVAAWDAETKQWGYDPDLAAELHRLEGISQ